MPGRRKTRRKTTLVLSLILLFLLLLLVGGAIFLKSDYAAARMCAAVQEGLQEGLGVRVAIAKCGIDLIPPTLEARQVTVFGRDEGRLVRADRLRVELDSLSLLAGSLRVGRIRVERPEVHLSIENGSVTNLPELKAAPAEDGEDAGFGMPERIEVEDGRVDLVVDRRLLVQLKELRAEMAARPKGALDLKVEAGSGGVDWVGSQGPSMRLRSFQLRARQENDDLRLEHFDLHAGELEVEAHGNLRMEGGGPRPDLHVRVTGPLDLLPKLVPGVPKMQGQAVVAADLSLGEGDGAPDVRGTVDVRDYGVETADGIDFKSRFHILGNRLHLDDLIATCRAGNVAGKAELELAHPWGFKGSLGLKEVRLGEALSMGGVESAPVGLQGAGRVDFHGMFQGKVGPYVILSLRLDPVGLQVKPAAGEPAVVALQRGKLRADAAFSGRRVRFPSFKLQIGESSLEGEGKIFFHDGAVSLDVRSPGLDLEAFSPLAGMPAAGRGSLDVKLRGHFPFPALEAQLQADDLALQGRYVGSVRGSLTLTEAELTIERMLVARHGGVVRLSGTYGLAAPHPVEGTVVLDGARLPEVFALVQGSRPPSFLDGQLIGELRATGSLQSPVLDFRLGFREVKLGGQVFEEGGVAGRFDQGAWHFDVVEARMGPGWVFARGGISEDLELNLSAYSTGLRAASFQALAGVQDVLDFRLDLHLTVKGPVRSPSFAGWLKFYDTQLKGRSLPESFVSAEATTESFEVKGRFLGGAAVLSGEARLEADLPFSSAVKLDTDRLGRFLSPLMPGLRPRASIQGEMEARGLLLRPRQIRGGLDLDRIQFQTTGIRLENRQPVRVALQGGVFTIEQCEVAGTDTVLTVGGGGSLRDGPRIHAEGTVGLGLFPVLSDILTRAVGRARVKLRFEGPWRAPRTTGAATFQADAIRIRGFPQDVGPVQGTLQFTPDWIQVTRLRGQMGGGSFAGQGQVEMQAFTPRKLTLNLEVDKVRYNVAKNLWGIGSGVLSLGVEEGQPARLSGEIRIHEGEYEERIRLVSFSDGIFRRRVAKARTYAVERELLALDIRLRIPEKFRVRYDLNLLDFQAEMGGNLHVTGTNERLGLQGEIEALQGTLTYLSKKFTLQSARVQFTESYAIHPRVDVLARLRETVDRGEFGKTNYRIDLRLTADGDSQPEIALTSDPPEEERDIITLLHFGFTTKDVETMKGEDLVGLGGEILFRSFKLEERLGKLFPFPPEVVQPKYLRVRSRFSPASAGQAGSVSPRLEVGAKLRIISDDLDVDYSRSLYDDTNQSLNLTYQLSNTVSTRLRWEEGFGQQATPGDIGDLGLDLKLEWEW